MQRCGQQTLLPTQVLLVRKCWNSQLNCKWTRGSRVIIKIQILRLWLAPYCGDYHIVGTEGNPGGDQSKSPRFNSCHTAFFKIIIKNDIQIFWSEFSLLIADKCEISTALWRQQNLKGKTVFHFVSFCFQKELWKLKMHLRTKAM